MRICMNYFLSFLILTAVIVASILAVVSRQDFEYFIQLGPLTDTNVLIASVFVIWLTAGITLLLAQRGKINRENVLLILFCDLITILYATILRERCHFADIGDYLNAAGNIINGAHFHPRYIYPPFWALVLATVYRCCGYMFTVIFCFTLNLLSIPVFFVLGSLFLNNCGLSLNFAGLLMLCATVVNVPLLRNAGYVQVNLLLLDTVLAGILFFAKSKAVSALSVCAGIYIKVVPALFVPLFVLTKKYVWFAYFLCAMILIFIITIIPINYSYYLDFYKNLSIWNETGLRSVSVNGFLNYSARFFSLKINTDIFANIIRAVLIGFTYVISYICYKKNRFAATPCPDTRALTDSCVPLMTIILWVSPTVWEHHLVFLILPAVLVFLNLTSLRQAVLFCAGWFFVFIMPVFDVYPWSYLRFAGCLIIYFMMVSAVLSGSRPRWVKNIDNALNTFISQISVR